MEHRHHIRDVLPDASDRLVAALENMDDMISRAETELEFDMNHGIVPLCFNDRNYPKRLAECADAPLVLYYKGNADLNQRRIISIVGTRRCTQYGRDMTARLIKRMRELLPKTLIVSGLAYGIDIEAHRNALACDFETVGVLAHGLDTIYPNAHRDTASDNEDGTALLKSADDIVFVCTETEIIGKELQVLAVALIFFDFAVNRGEIFLKLFPAGFKVLTRLHRIRTFKRRLCEIHLPQRFPDLFFMISSDDQEDTGLLRLLR